VGIALAESPYVAFLNHDDYWLPNHLEIALRTLETAGSDMYWSRAAFFTNRGAWGDRIFFDEVSPKGRRLEDMYDGPFFLAEPMSSWVVLRQAVDTLGPMKLANETWQLPVVEYCQRASKKGLSLATKDEITVLKDRVWNAPPRYDSTAEYAETMVAQIESRNTTELERQIDQDIWLSFALGLNRPTSSKKYLTGQSHMAKIDRLAGLNLADINASSKDNGSSRLLSTILKHRTGEAIDRQPNLSDMITFARGESL
jgi:hypothetical protein